VQRVWVSVVSVTPTPGDDVNRVDRAAAARIVAAMNAYWSAESNGQVSIALGGFETSSLSEASCAASTVFAKGPSVAFSGRFADERWRGTSDHLLLLSTEACGSAGLGSVGGDGGVMFSGNGESAELGIPVAVHEFGHNLGFGHAGSSMCRSTDTLDGAPRDFADGGLCSTDDYGDYLDIMGYSLAGSQPHLSSAQRIRNGWMSDFTDLTAASGSVTTTVTPLGGGAGNRAIRVTDPLSGERYYIEYRTPSGADASSTEFTRTLTCTTTGGYSSCSRGSSTGVVRILRELPYPGYSGYERTTVLAVGAVEGDPTTRTTGLSTGARFTSANGGFYVRVNSAGDAAGASVTVRFAAPASTDTTVSGKSTHTFGSKSALTVGVATSDGSTANGTVVFRDGKTVLGRATVTGGRARLALPATLSVGSHAMTASFEPATGDALPSTSAVHRMKVAKTSSTTRVRVTATSGGKATVRVTVASKGAISKGTVRVYAGGKRVAAVKVGAMSKGKVTVKIRAPRAGKATVTARFSGTSTAAASSSSTKVRIR
jgi:hypothetical protein